MIVDVHARRVILTPPKVGGTHLRWALCQYPQVFSVIGPNPVNWFDLHSIAIPVDYVDFEKVILVRHPLDRLKSQYRHYREQVDENADFATWLVHVRRDDSALYWIYRYTIARWLRWCEHRATRHVPPADIQIYDAVWRLEDLATHVAEHYPRVALRSPYLQTTPGWEELLADADTLAAAVEWCREDFTRFGYPLP